MKKPLTPTDLRGRLYRVLDEVAETGEPQEVVRGGQRFLILSADLPRRRLEDLPRRDIFACTPDELVATSFEWEPPEEA
jgi:hypothetical protein